MRAPAMSLTALAVLLAAGCGGPKPPPTYPAGGKAAYADGVAMTGGTVQFQSQTDGSPSAVGEIGPYGKFTLYTLVEGKKYAGAVEGSYRVTVIPPQGADQAARPAQPATLTDVFTVKAQGGNEFTLKIPR